MSLSYLITNDLYIFALNISDNTFSASLDNTPSVKCSESKVVGIILNVLYKSYSKLFNFNKSDIFCTYPSASPFRLR